MRVDIHEIPLPPDLTGRMWLCGKHTVAPDPEGLLERHGADVVVCLNPKREIERHYPRYVEWLRREAGTGRAVWQPIHDLGALPLDEYRSFLADLVERLEAGRSLIVHCGAGIGRAGTTAVGVLVMAGIPLDEALDTVRSHRPMAGPEAGSQSQVVRQLAAEVRERGQ